MNNCPHCDHKAMGLIRKAFLGPARPIPCQHCGTRLVTPFNAHVYIAATVITIALGIGITVADHAGLPPAVSRTIMVLWFVAIMIYHTIHTPLVEHTQVMRKRVKTTQLAILVILATSAIAYLLWQYT